MAEREIIPIRSAEEKKALQDKLRAEGFFPKDEFDDITCEFENLDEEAAQEAKKTPGYEEMPWHKQTALKLSIKRELVDKYYPGYYDF